MKLKFATVGSNFICEKFISALSRSKNAELWAVYSRTGQKALEFAKAHNAKAHYSSFDEMLKDENIDAVYISSPNIFHAEQSIAALNAGKHVLCEKPIASSAAELEAMKEAAMKNGRVLLEAMRPEFDPALEIISEALPRAGRIRSVSLEYCQYSSRYDKFKNGIIENAFKPSLCNSALMDIGIYPLHCCLSLFGMPNDITSKSVFLDNGFEGCGNALLAYDGFIASVKYSKITDSVNPSVIEGENGAVVIDRIHETNEISFVPRGGKTEKIPYEKPLPDNMHLEIDFFTDAVCGKADFAEKLSVSESTMKCADMIKACSKIDFS